MIDCEREATALADHFNSNGSGVAFTGPAGREAFIRTACEYLKRAQDDGEKAAFVFLGRPNELPCELRAWIPLGGTCVDGLMAATSRIRELETALRVMSSLVGVKP